MTRATQWPTSLVLLLISTPVVWADNVALGTAEATYISADGHVWLEANGIAFWQLHTDGQFIGQPNDLGSGRWTVPGTVKQADASDIGELALSNSIVFDNVFNGGTFQFDYSGIPGDLGQLLPAGLTPQDLLGATFSYNTLGGQQVTVPLFPVPESSTLCVASFGLASLLGLGLRRRRKIANLERCFG